MAKNVTVVKHYGRVSETPCLPGEDPKRAEYGFREYGFKHRTQWVSWPSPSSREITQWVPLSLLFVCQSELTEFFLQNSPSLPQNSVSSHKNLFGLFLFCKVIFRDPPKIPFKTNIKLTFPRLFLPRKVIFALRFKRLKITRKDS